MKVVVTFVTVRGNAWYTYKVFEIRTSTNLIVPLISVCSVIVLRVMNSCSLGTEMYICILRDNGCHNITILILF